MGYPKRSCPWWVDGGSGSTWFVYCVSCLSVLSNFTEGKSLPIIKFKCSLTMMRCSFTSIQLHDSITNILLYFLHFFIYLCVCVCVRTRMLPCVPHVAVRGELLRVGSLLLLCGLGIKLELPGLAAGSFTRWAISLALLRSFFCRYMALLQSRWH